MLQGQPKGLYALALANTGERFGYYTMLAIFTLFLQAKFGYTAAETVAAADTTAAETETVKEGNVFTRLWQRIVNLFKF